MSRTAIAVLLLAALAAPAGAAPATLNTKLLDKTLDGIQTAAGISLAKRLASCNIVLHKDQSSMETLTAPKPDYGAKAGDTVLTLVLDFPPVPKQVGPSLPAPQQKNVKAIWIIDKTGKTTALSAWANVLLNRPVPLGYDASNNC
ncbi:MAG TPA: hypothetical protein VMU01_04485 [Rhizomicrobium sp.]|nr:hypothetical protein [Rhizomicrobium sp.]